MQLSQYRLNQSEDVIPLIKTIRQDQSYCQSLQGLNTQKIAEVLFDPSLDKEYYSLVYLLVLQLSSTKSDLTGLYPNLKLCADTCKAWLQAANFLTLLE